jgi:hypothetical protein
MKKLYTILVFLFISIICYSQITITNYGNSPVLGDSIISLEIQNISPGSAGPDQIWDFSQIDFTGKNQLCVVNKMTDSGIGNFTTNEDGRTFKCNVSENNYMVSGYFTSDLSLTYDPQIVKMKYPFSFGDRYSSPISGYAYYNLTSGISFSGDNTITADAYGTLVLPDFNIKNTLRVRTEKNAFEVRECSDMTGHSVQYCWYAPGFRYPVLTINTLEYQASNQDKQTQTQTAFLSLQQSGASYAGVQQNSIDKNDFTVAVYPNPFSDNLTFSYFLRKQMPVSICLYDISGKKCLEACNNLQQSEGLHAGNIENADKLPTGVYSVKFTFDHNTIVKKVVKI